MLIDHYGRKIDYLRISVTHNCNLRCFYCNPVSLRATESERQLLSVGDIYKIVSVASKLGIEKVRITGGEPLLRKELPFIVKALRKIKRIKEITLTTNGVYLQDYAYILKRNGLDRINVSLDSLVPKKYNKITCGGNIYSVLQGIKTAISVGFSSIKINTVLIKEFNDNEILAFANLTKTNSIQVRFIEIMPTNLNYASYNSCLFSVAKAKEILDRLGKLEQINCGLSNPAEVYRIAGYRGSIGFVSPITKPFCLSCNRLRLTAEGYLKSCLYSAEMISLREIINNGNEKELGLLIEKAVSLKPKAHKLFNQVNILDGKSNIHRQPVIKENDWEIENINMCQIGG